MFFLFCLILPFVEIYLLFLAVKAFGFLNVLAVIVITGWLGVRLVKSQGLFILNQFQMRMSSGQLPKRETVDSLLILIAGLLLIAPGFITDGLGLLCLIPWTRNIIRAFFIVWIEKKIRLGKFKVYTASSFGGFKSSTMNDMVESKISVRDVTPKNAPELNTNPRK